MTACVGDCLREYFALRVEMASVVEAAGQPGERHTGLIHSILARSEERLTASLDARAEELGDDLHRIEIMIKLLVQLYLAHTPEVPQERRTAAYAAIAGRWANYQAAVAEQVAEDDVAGAKPKDNEEDRARMILPTEDRRRQIVLEDSAFQRLLATPGRAEAESRGDASAER
jgi:hypothetical protein